jgi:nucleoside-diphosphate-sugar epimerase
MLVTLLTVCIILLSTWNPAESLRQMMRLSMMASKYLGKEPVFVAGGSSGVGFELIKKLSALGTPVHALIRRPEVEVYFKTLPGVKVSLGDALDPEAVQKAMQGCIAAVTTLGGQPAAGQVERVDYAGNSNVIEQAGILGIERVVLVTRLVIFSYIFKNELFYFFYLLLFL